MYIQTSIAKLSRNQLKNLLEGKRVRIKKGSAHHIHLTEAQLKKLEAATKLKKLIQLVLHLNKQIIKALDYFKMFIIMLNAPHILEML